MQDRDAETTVRIDIRVIQGSNELEVCEKRLAYTGTCDGWLKRTWWLVGVVFGKGEFRLEVAPVIQRVRVQDDEGHAPLEDVLVDQLRMIRLAATAICGLDP